MLAIGSTLSPKSNDFVLPVNIPTRISGNIAST